MCTQITNTPTLNIHNTRMSCYSPPHGPFRNLQLSLNISAFSLFIFSVSSSLSFGFSPSISLDLFLQHLSICSSTHLSLCVSPPSICFSVPPSLSTRQRNCTQAVPDRAGRALKGAHPVAIERALGTSLHRLAGVPSPHAAPPAGPASLAEPDAGHPGFSHLDRKSVV